jgi:hypothetical protein
MPLHIEGVAVIDKGRRPPCPVQPRPGNLISNALSYKSIPPTVDYFVTDFELTGSQFFLVAGVAHEETIFIFQSSILVRKRGAAR